MIAYKTYATCPVEQRPLEIPLTIVWQQEAITSEQQADHEAMGFTVVSEADFATYQASQVSIYVAWANSQIALLTKNAILKKINQYQLKAPSLINDLMATNTMLGISTKQSYAMFLDYADLMLQLNAGAFPTALYGLTLKRPAGFVTQNLIDQWIQKIQDAML